MDIGKLLCRIFKRKKLSKRVAMQLQLDCAKETLIDLRLRAHELSELARFATKRIAELQAEIDRK